MEPITDSKNLMECVYFWEKNTPDRMYLTQPLGGGDAKHQDLVLERSGR